MVENGKNCRLEINLHYYASLPLCRPIGGFWQIGVQILQQLQLQIGTTCLSCTSAWQTIYSPIAQSSMGPMISAHGPAIKKNPTLLLATTCLPSYPSMDGIVSTNPQEVSDLAYNFSDAPMVPPYMTKKQRIAERSILFTIVALPGMLSVVVVQYYSCFSMQVRKNWSTSVTLRERPKEVPTSFDTSTLSQAIQKSNF